MNDPDQFNKQLAFLTIVSLLSVLVITQRIVA